MAKGRLDTVLQHIRRYLGGTGARDLTDRQLLELFASRRDEPAFAVLVERHGPLVMSVCRRILRQTQDAEDVFQATFLVLARKAASVRWQDSVKNWLYQVAYRLASEARDKITRQRNHQRQLASQAKAESLRPEAVQKLSDLLDEELQRLPVKYRSCLLLCYLEGQTRDQAATQLGWSLRTLERRLAQGRELLRSRLTRRGLSLSAALLAGELASTTTSAALQRLPVACAVRAASQFASGPAETAGAISVQAAALAEGLLKSMALAPLRSAAALVLLVSLVAASVGIVIQQVPAVKQAITGSVESIPAVVDPDEPRAEKEEPARKDSLGDPLPPRALARMGSARLRHYTSLAYLDTAFSPDSKILLTIGNSKSVCLWSTATGKLVTQIEDGTGHVGLPTFSPNYKWLALTGDRVVKLYDPATGRSVRRIPAQGFLSNHAVAMAFSPDSKVLAVAIHRSEISIWDPVTGRKTGSLDAKGMGGHDSIYYVRFAPGGRTLVSMGYDPKHKEYICHWDLTTQMLGQRIDVPKRGSTLVLSNDGQTVAGPADGGKVRVWDTTTGQERCVLQGELTRATYGVGFSLDGKVLATAWTEPGSEEATLSLWDTTTGKAIRRFPVPSKATSMIQFSPDGHLLVTGGGGPLVHVWDTAKGQRLLNPPGHESMISRLAFTPDGRNLVSSDPFTLRVWDAATGKPQQVMHDAARQPPADAPPRRWTSPVFALLPSGRALLHGGTDGMLCLTELDTGKELRRFVLDRPQEELGNRDRQVHHLGLAADGRTAAVVSSSSQPKSSMIHVWDLTSARTLVQRPDASQQQWSAFSPDAKVLSAFRHSFSASEVRDPTAKAGTRTIEATHVLLEEVATGRTLLTLTQPNHSGYIQAFSPDGQTLATTTFSLLGAGNQQRMGQSSLHLWELATGKERLRITGTKSGYAFGYEKMAFAPDGRILATARKDGTIQLWDTATAKELLRRTGYGAPIYCLTFAPDCKTLASGHLDSTILVWDVAQAAARFYRPDRPAEARELQGWWEDLAGTSAHKAHAAIWALVSVPRQALPILRDRLQPAAAVQAVRLRQLVSDLDNKQFQLREAATKQLAEFAEQAEPTLREALQAGPSAEQRRRIEELLAGPRLVPLPETLRALRALQVLEHIGDPAARRLLANLAKGAAHARLTQEAEAALGRLARRSAQGP